MGEETDPAATGLAGSAQEVYSVQQEARLLRAKLAQREAVIIELNRRLRRLEQLHGQGEADGQGRPVGWDDRIGDLQREIDALHATKTFRYTDGLRRFYGRVLRLGGR